MATLIHDKTDLQNMNLDLAGDYELANDIDASGAPFTPLGTFTGTLDGKGFNINDLIITVIGVGTEYGAFINTNQGTIKNLGLVDCVISVTATISNALAGSLVFYNDVTGIINNCHCSGTLTVIGTTDCSSAGGLAFSNDGQIDDSYSLVITSITAPNAHAGGFIVENIGTINNSYARGNTTVIGAASYAAGFIDHNYAGGVITNSYSTGIPSATNKGGFCRVNDDTITACFWDITTSGVLTSDGGTGKTTAQMKNKFTFTNAGWDMGTSIVTHNGGYPYLGWEYGETPTWRLYKAAYVPVPSPRDEHPVEDKVTLEAIRNVEMSGMGRFHVDEEGNARYESRFARNP
ncbi:MAG: hypothetical protein MUO61_03480 [Dehalococcoidia bacterium]|nr:hypothetical protein [Dehalococcoidia bacterium]